ncbi:MAG: hypothetical protein EXR79_12480 [Myxococcales bacterium]|nr:hypothetical protein [Myxococcales bacterium]
MLVGIYLDGTYAPGLYVLAGGCLAVWWLTRSLQSARLWVDVRRVELVRRSGLAIGRIRTVRVPLAEAFEANHVPVHAGADRRRTPPVAPTTTAWRLARDHLGSEPDARTWLRAAARTLGFTPAAHFGRNEAT